MTLYWLLFLFPAVMALLAPARRADDKVPMGQTLALIGFIIAYILLATLRYNVGGDWLNYQDMYDNAVQSTLREAMANNDPGFGLALWLSARAGLGIYPVNGLCAALLVLGTARVALATREPWLALLAAVPYLLIVVGMGYVRQAGAIGLMLLAIGAIGQRRWADMAISLALAPCLHLTSAISFPLVLRTLARGRRWLSVVLVIVGLAIFILLIRQNFATYEQNYIEEEYNSGGAFVRIAMSALPSLLLLLCWRRFPVAGRLRDVWLGFAIANIVAVVAVVFSPSSTAVDRMALYFSPVQIIVFGCLMDLLALERRAVFLMRSLVIGLLACVQAVWLMLGTYAQAWVPYHSLLYLP